MTAGRPRIVVLGGPTASGKSALGVALALRFGGEIVNADSQQVYRGMDVGTGKPSPADREAVPHHLYDLVDSWEQLDAAQYVALADEAIADIAARGRLPIVVGGTGLWLRALHRGLVDAPPRDEAIRARLEAEAEREGWPALHERLAQVDPYTAARVHQTDPVRIIRALEVYETAGVPLGELHRQHALGEPRYPALHLAVDWPREALDARIQMRVGGMFGGGLVEETRALLADERARARVERVMGYREAAAFLSGSMSREAAIERTVIAQRQYAKRQRTWLRGEDWWTWLDGESAPTTAPALCLRFLSDSAEVDADGSGRTASSRGKV